MNRRHLLQSLPALALPSWTLAAAPMTVQAAEQQTLLTGLADALRRRYVFPDVGQRYAQHLLHRADASKQAKPQDPLAFAATLTAELQAIHADGHLAVTLVSDAAPGPERNAQRPVPRPADQPHPSLAAAELRGEAAYLRFLSFPFHAGMATAVRSFLIGPGAAAKAVVLDLRDHRGGTLLVMDALLPLLYAEPRRLLRMDTRSDAIEPGRGASGPTLQRQPSPQELVRQDHIVEPDSEHRSLQGVPVVALISAATVSAGEHLAMALKASGRGYLIGERTAGAGRFGGPVQVGRFEAWIPIGRTYDPQTGQEWEGTGVEPHLRVPKEQAIEAARVHLSRLGVAFN